MRTVADPVYAFGGRQTRSVGDLRVFYDLSGTTIEVLAIVAKSEAESWLAQFGNPE